MTTIHIRPELKARLRRFPEINVSFVCRRALEAEVERCETRERDLCRRDLCQRLALVEPSGWPPE